MMLKRLQQMVLVALMLMLALAALPQVAQAALTTGDGGATTSMPLRRGSDDDDDDDDRNDDSNDDDDNDDDEDGIEIKGIVSQMPAGLIGEWVIGGNRVVADRQTWFDPQRNNFFVGACVEAELRRASNIILNLKTDNDCTGAPGGGAGVGVREVKGILNQLPAGNLGVWVVDGIRYTVDAQTTFVAGRDRFAPGVCVELDVRPDNRVVSAKTDNDCSRSAGNTAALREMHGTVTRRPGGLFGQWVIGGVTVTADSRTWISQRHAPLLVGACAEVKYRADGTAIKIEAKPARECSGLRA